MPERTASIAFFDAYSRTRSGAQIVLELLASGVREQGWQAEALLPSEGPVADAMRAAGVDVEIVTPPPPLMRYGRTTRGLGVVAALVALPPYWWRVRGHLRGRVDVLHVDDHRGLILVGPAARLAGVPIVWHVHSVLRNRLLNAIGSRLAARVVVPARAILSQMPELDRPRPAIVLPNPVRPEVLGITRREPARPTIVSIARLRPDKGIDVLFEAVERLLNDVPHLRVVVIGGSQPGWERHEQELLTLRTSLGLDSVIEMTGQIDAPETVLAEASVYAQPSREHTELLPLAILEAMSIGVPVVASRVGAIEEIVKHECTGLLVEPDDAAALASALRRLLTEKALVQRLVDNACERVRVDHAPEPIIDRVLDSYTELLMERRA